MPRTKTYIKHIMYQGQTFEVEVAQGEKFDPNDYLDDIRNNKATLVDDSQGQAAAESDDDDNDDVMAKLRKDLLDSENTERVGTVAWYKKELDGFDGVNYTSGARLQELREQLEEVHANYQDS